MSIRRVACALSGGVDSAASAFLLKRRGFDVTGVFMTNWDARDETGFCSAERDLRDAEFVCRQLGLPLLHLNFTKEYWNFVFSRTLAAYSRGHTPNPDVLCNRHIKFNCLYRRCIDELGFDALATGHYARTSFGDFLERCQPGVDVRLLCSADPVKDQTFWLCQVPQEALRRAMFPVGSWLKPEVKRLCRDVGLARVAARRESMGMCFIGKRRFADFIDEYVEPRPGGAFVELESGRRLPLEHNGVHHFTIGQRPALCFDHKRRYVAKLCADTNTVHLVDSNEHPALYFAEFECEPAHWICAQPQALTAGGMRCQLRWQNKWRAVGCVVRPGGGQPGGLTVRLDEPMRCVAPGQFAVFYDNGECVGSARIASSVSLYERGRREPVAWSCEDFLVSYGQGQGEEARACHPQS